MADSADKYTKAVANAESLMSRGDYSKAAKTASDAAAANPQRYEAFLTAAQAFRLQAHFAELEDKEKLAGQASGNLKKAVNILKQINVTAPSTKDLDYAVHLDAAWTADAANLVSKAAVEYEAAYLSRPGDANAAFGAMVAFKRTLDYGKAEKYARILLVWEGELRQQAKLELPKLQELPPQVTNALAAVKGLVDQGRLEEAEAKAREQLDRMPFVGELHFWVGFALARRGEVQASIVSFREAVKQGFNSETEFVRAAEIPAILRNEGFLTLVADGIGESGRKAVLELWDKKETQIRRETRAKYDTHMADAHEAIGQNEFAKARSEALKARSLIPDEAAVQKILEEIDNAEYARHLTAGQDASARKEFALARAETLKAQQLRPADPEPQRLLQAIAAAERLERVARTLKEARDALAQRHFETATRKATQALEMMPDNGEAKILLAEIEQAVQWDKMERAEKLIAHARSVYRRDRGAALSAIEQAIGLTPNNSVALSLGKAIEAFWVRVDQLRSRLNGIALQKPRLATLEAIAELRSIFPNDDGLQKLWEEHCSFANPLGMRFHFVCGPTPAGEGGDNNVPRGFFIAQYETTESQWENIMGRSNSLYTDGKVWTPDGTPYQPSLGHPVCQITAAEAVAFCDKLSARDGRRYRLPTEREWEYACTAGQPAPQLSTASLTNRAWFFFNCQRDGQSYPHSVGQKQPNSFGLYDMIGNLAELCAPTISGTNLTDIAVLKGGSWKDPVEVCEPRSRVPFSPGQREKWAGFRAVYEPEE